jgi:hypothetical protein
LQTDKNVSNFLKNLKPFKSTSEGAASAPSPPKCLQSRLVISAVMISNQRILKPYPTLATAKEVLQCT